MSAKSMEGGRAGRELEVDDILGLLVEFYSLSLGVAFVPVVLLQHSKGSYGVALM